MPQGTWREFEQPSSTRFDKAKSTLEKSTQNIRVQKTRVGKGGKTVTMISGLTIDGASLKALLKKLKARCGTGGTYKSNLLELQGDQVELALEVLQNEGYSPKKSGG